MADDVASGAYWFLTSQSDVTAVVGAFPADDPDNAGVPWIFVRNVATRLETASIIKGTQAVALVCCFMGQAATPNASSTARSQRLEVDIWVDPLRDSMGNVTNPSETESRGLNVFSVIDSHLHRVATDQNTVVWGNLVTTGSTRMTEPVWYPVPDGDGLIRGACFYEVACFGNTGDLRVSSGDGGGGQ
jgi:hypothetical protein